jgi:hypothetical protein
MKHRILLTFILASLLLAGCGANPRADAERALARGDRRLVGYMGYGLVVPGTPAGFEHWSYGPGVRVLPGVTDTSPVGEIREADAYASRYNRVILGGSRRAP